MVAGNAEKKDSVDPAAVAPHVPAAAAAGPSTRAGGTDPPSPSHDSATQGEREELQPRQPGAGPPRIHPRGVLELLLRGHMLADIIEDSSIPALAIVEAFDDEEDFARLGRLRRTIGEFRAIHLEHMKLDALSRLFQIGLRLREEYPEGMTGDDVRLIEAERRACVSLMRLSAFPRASESRQDERGPRVPDVPGSSAGANGSGGEGGGGSGVDGGDVRPGGGRDPLEEIAELWGRVPLSVERRRAAGGRKENGIAARAVAAEAMNVRAIGSRGQEAASAKGDLADRGPADADRAAAGSETGDAAPAGPDESGPVAGRTANPAHDKHPVEAAKGEKAGSAAGAHAGAAAQNAKPGKGGGSASRAQSRIVLSGGGAFLRSMNGSESRRPHARQSDEKDDRAGKGDRDDHPP